MNLERVRSFGLLWLVPILYQQLAAHAAGCEYDLDELDKLVMETINKRFEAMLLIRSLLENTGNSNL